MSDQLRQVYTAFSGADIVATFNGRVIGELQAITYSITREKAPIYTMGSPDPRSFARGKRGIAGSLIFTVFDRDSLADELNDFGKGQVNGFSAYGNAREAMSINDWNNQMQGSQSEIIDRATVAHDAFYSDELPPFDITITFANEYGQMAHMVVYGVEILNEGSGMSVDDIVTERAMTFVARKIDRMKPLAKTGGKALG